MTPDRLEQIRRSAELVAYTERGEFGGEKLATYQLAAHVVPELLAEVERLTTLTATCCCGTSPMTYEGPEPDCPVHGAVRAFNEATHDIAQLQAAVEHLTAQLRQAKEERAAVALERDEAINDRSFAVFRAIRVERVAEAAKTAVEVLSRTTIVWPKQSGKTALSEVLNPLIAAVDEWQRTQEATP